MTDVVGIGYGASVLVNDGPSNAFVHFNDCKSIKLPQIASPLVKSTKLNTANRRHTYVPGIAEIGSMSFECEHTDAEYARLLGLHDVSKSWEVFTSQGGHASFTGHVSKSELDIPLEEIEMITVEVIVEGNYEFTASE